VGNSRGSLQTIACGDGKLRNYGFLTFAYRPPNAFLLPWPQPISSRRSFPSADLVRPTCATSGRCPAQPMSRESPSAARFKDRYALEEVEIELRCVRRPGPQPGASGPRPLA